MRSCVIQIAVLTIVLDMDLASLDGLPAARGQGDRSAHKQQPAATGPGMAEQLVCRQPPAESHFRAEQSSANPSRWPFQQRCCLCASWPAVGARARSCLSPVLAEIDRAGKRFRLTEPAISLWAGGDYYPRGRPRDTSDSTADESGRRARNTHRGHPGDDSRRPARRKRRPGNRRGWQGGRSDRGGRRSRCHANSCGRPDLPGVTLNTDVGPLA